MSFDFSSLSTRLKFANVWPKMRPKQSKYLKLGSILNSGPIMTTKDNLIQSNSK